MNKLQNDFKYVIIYECDGKHCIKISSTLCICRKKLGGKQKVHVAYIDAKF